jgi:class 3 adenylate cyclase/tetratricopeptide (TPR) repeat protein
MGDGRFPLGRSPLDYTPPFLVEKILKSRSIIEGERKLVTVFFADVADFTPMAERLDPEDVHEIMDDCFEILGEEIHGAGGTINQYTGDGVMALFGAPLAHEDHVRRACHAALMVQKRLKRYGEELAGRYEISFRMRIGLHTGLVVVGAIGDNLRLDYTAVGDTTNLAARLGSLAPPGGILVSERVRESAKSDFLFLEVGLLEVKGKMRNVRAFLLDRRLEADLSEARTGGDDLFVDRERECAALETALKKMVDGDRRLVSVTGEAGIGKTRLLRFFRGSVQEKSILFLEGHCRPFGETTAFHPLIGMFRTYFTLSERDGFQTARKKILGRIGDHSLKEALLQILRLFEETTAEQKHAEVVDKGNKRRLFQALHDLVLAVSSLRPLVVVLDDMQWVDATTREFLIFLLQSSGISRLLLICLSRTDPGPWCPDVPHESIPLQPLDRESSALLFTSVVGTDRLNAEVTEEIISNAGGNPLFLLEMGETLKRFELVVCDSKSCTLRLPLKEIQIPDTIHGVLAARLDALEEGEKKLVQLASVVGREFSSDFLESLGAPWENLAGNLEKLKKEGIIDRVSLAEGGRYRFRHQLLREVAYHSLLRRDRRRYHREVGETMERMLGENPGDLTGFLAHHFHEAEEWSKALVHTIRAGQQAGRTYACSEAVASFDRALSLLSKPKMEAHATMLPTIHLWKGRMSFCLGRLKKARDAFESMLAEAERFKDTRMQGEALFRLGWVLFYLHHPAQSASLLTRAIALARKEDLTDILPKAIGFLGYTYAVLGKLKESKPLLDEALRISESQGGIEGKAWSIAHLIQYHNWTGEFEKALTLSEELHHINQDIRSPYFNIILHFRRGLIYGATGRLQEAEKTLLEGLRHLEIGDDTFWRPRFLNTLGWVYGEGGDQEKALNFNRESLREARKTGDPETVRNARINLGENLLAMGLLEEAGEELENTWEEVKKRGTDYARWRYKTRLLIDLGEFYGRRGERKRGLDFLNRAIRLARKSGARKHEAKALFFKGRILADVRPGPARLALEQALALSRAMGTRRLTERIDSALAENQGAGHRGTR